MKKLLLFASIVLTLSCSSDDNSSSNSSSKITPPTWIQGTWAEETIYHDTGSIFGFKFTSNDACTIIPTLENCFGSSSDLSQGQIRFEQSISDTEYKLVMKTDLQSTTIAHVRKISATKIISVAIIDNEFSPTYIKVN